MKITALLNEQFDIQGMNPMNPSPDMGAAPSDGVDGGDTNDMVRTPSLADSKLQFNDLTIYQVATIRKLGRGTLNIEDASEKEMNAIEELIDFGILDDNVEFTELGKKALAKSEGGSYDSRRYGELHKNDAKQKQTMQPAMDFDGGEDTDEDELNFSDEPAPFR